MLELVQPLSEPSVLPLKNERWEAFANKFLECDTLSETARAIGIAEQNVGTEGRRLVNIPEVKARIKYLESEQRKRAIITEGTITEEIAIIAYSSLDDYVTGQLVTEPVIRVKDGVNPKQLRAISEIEVTDTASGVRKVKFKLHSKTAALQMAMELKGYGAKNKVNAVNALGVGAENEKGKAEKESPEEILTGLGLKVA